MKVQAGLCPNCDLRPVRGARSGAHVDRKSCVAVATSAPGLNASASAPRRSTGSSMASRCFMMRTSGGCCAANDSFACARPRQTCCMVRVRLRAAHLHAAARCTRPDVTRPRLRTRMTRPIPGWRPMRADRFACANPATYWSRPPPDGAACGFAQQSKRRMQAVRQGQGLQARLTGKHAVP